MHTKTVYIQTNFNNKMDCQCMVHVDFAPTGPISESALDRYQIRIKTLDNSHPPALYKLVDIYRFDLFQIRSAFTRPSHGMDLGDYSKWLTENYPEKIKADTKMAAFYYQKIEV